MPKEYPNEVKLFALQQKREGRTWDEVRELIKQEFGLDPAPGRRQMIKWVASVSVPGVVIDNVGRGLSEYVTQMLYQQKDVMTKIVTEAMNDNKDFNVLIVKWMLSQMKGQFGFEKLQTAWKEFEAESKQKIDSEIKSGSAPVGEKK